MYKIEQPSSRKCSKKKNEKIYIYLIYIPFTLLESNVPYWTAEKPILIQMEKYEISFCFFIITKILTTWLKQKVNRATRDNRSIEEKKIIEIGAWAQKLYVNNHKRNTRRTYNLFFWCQLNIVMSTKNINIYNTLQWLSDSCSSIPWFVYVLIIFLPLGSIEELMICDYHTD